MPTLLNPADVRSQQLVDVDLGDGTFVRARRMDLPLMLMEGNVPLPLLSAARDLVEHKGPPEEALAAVDHDESLRVLRRHAIFVVVEPLIVEQDDHNPDHLPVALLTVPQLLAIWNATAVLPKVGAALAAEFCERAVLDAAPALRGREDVRPPAQRVARAGRDDGPAFLGS